MEVSGQLEAPATSPAGKDCRGDLDAVAKRKIPTLVTNRNPIVQPATSNYS